MSLEKNQLKRLMELDNPKADEYLANLASQLQQQIEASDNNDDIVEKLELLVSFVYKVPDTAIQIIDFVLVHSHPTSINKTPLGEFEGKTHKDVILKCIELLECIRYYKPDEVLDRLVPLVLSSEEKIRHSARETLKKFAKYDFNILMKSNLGYRPQAKALEFIKRWSPSGQLDNFDFVEIIAKELLGATVEGTSINTLDTVTIHFGAVQPTDFLKQLRRDTIGIVYSLYEHTYDDFQKVRLVKVLEEAVRTPTHGTYSDELLEMVTDDARYLIDIYRKVLFDQDNHLVGSIAVAEEVEKRLYWFYRNDKVKTPEAEQLREDILADRFYSLFHLLAGDDLAFKDEEGWSVAEAKRTAAIAMKINEIEESRLSRWIDDLNKIAAQLGLVGEWQFRHFSYFLKRLAAQKPDLAKGVFNDALQGSKPLNQFASYLLEGFREASRFDLWDWGVEEIARKRDPKLVSAIAYSFSFGKDVDWQREIREEDLLVLESIVMQQNSFAFLENQGTENYVLRNAVLNALIQSYRRDPQRIERLIIQELKSFPDAKKLQVNVLAVGNIRELVDYSEFSSDGIAFLKSWLIELNDLDWHAQDLLLSLGKKDLQVVLDVFWERIKKQALRERKRLDEQRYEAVPYNFSEDLRRYLSEHSEFMARIEPWLEEVTPEWSLYNWHISRFLDVVGNSYDQVLRPMIERGDKISLAKAAQLMHRFGGTNVNLLMDVVRRTDDSSILGHIESQLYSTGVVSGEYGLMSAYASKAETLNKYLTDPSERVREFARRMIDNLKESAEHERQRVEEEKQLRRIEFEG